MYKIKHTGEQVDRLLKDVFDSTLQTKDIDVTENGVIEVTPDEGYLGLAKVNVNVEVPTEGGGDDDMVFFNTSLFADENSMSGLLYMTIFSGPINKNTLYATFYTGTRVAASDSTYNQMFFDNDISYIGISNKIVPYMILIGSGSIPATEEMRKEMTLYEFLEMVEEMGFLLLNESIDSIKSAEVTKDEVIEWLNAQS